MFKGFLFFMELALIYLSTENIFTAYSAEFGYIWQTSESLQQLCHGVNYLDVNGGWNNHYSHRHREDQMCVSTNIIRPARQELCNCNFHGRMICALGTASPEFSDKETALSIAIHWLKERAIVAEEFRAIREEIQSSSLYSKAEDVPLFLRTALETYNDARVFGEILPELAPHQFIEETMKTLKVDPYFTLSNESADVISINTIQ